MQEPEIISRVEAELLVSASPAAFTAFAKRYGLRPLVIAQGIVYRRSALYAAIAKALEDAEHDGGSADQEAA